MVDNFYFTYVGSKSKEYKEIKNYFPKNIKTIIEPFCGSCAVSRQMWKEEKYKNCNFILNDLNNLLIEFYNIVKHDKLDDFVEQINQYKDITKEEYNLLVNPKSNELLTLNGYFLGLTYHNFRPNIYPIINGIRGKFRDYKKHYTKVKYNDFYKNTNTQLRCEDYNIVLEEYKDDTEAFIFLDPPYMNSYNAYYGSGIDIESIFKNLLYHLHNSKANIMLVVQGDFFMKIIFEKYIKCEYSKTYEMTRKQTSHLIITNYEI